MDNILNMFSYDFILRAFIVGSLVSLCAALLGVSLVLKRYSMIGDGLSHVGFGSMAAAAAMGLAPLKLAIPVVILAAFFLLRLNEKSRIKGDAAIALFSSGALAIGIMIVSLNSGLNTDVMNYMFGSILSLSFEDAVISIVLSGMVLAMYLLFYPRIFAVTFDETFSRATGTRTGAYNSLIAVLTAVTIVLGMRMMGALLISSLVIFPPLTAMSVCKRFSSVAVLSAMLSAVCFFAGMVLSYIMEAPAGASVVCVNIIAFVIFRFIGYIKSR